MNPSRVAIYVFWIGSATPEATVVECFNAAELVAKIAPEFFPRSELLFLKCEKSRNLIFVHSSLKMGFQRISRKLTEFRFATVQFQICACTCSDSTEEYVGIISHAVASAGYFGESSQI